MNVVDTSGWIEYLRRGPNVAFFRPAIHDLDHLLIPTICLAEVIRFVTRAVNRDAAAEAAANMQRGTVVPLDANLADLAARLGLKHNLPLADSIVYATAQAAGAALFTQDEDFRKLPGVGYVRKK
jgi:predicted nucleic acid-binding protein